MYTLYAWISWSSVVAALSDSTSDVVAAAGFDLLISFNVCPIFFSLLLFSHNLFIYIDVFK